MAFMSNHRTPGPLGSNPHGRSPFKGLNPGPGGFAPANPTGLDGGKATGEEDEILRPVDVPPGFKPERCLSEKPTAESLGDTDDFTTGGPTVVCDGNGGYRVDMAGKEGLLYGKCLRIHEESHIEDLKAICPDGCKDKKNGASHPTDGSGCPAFKDADAYRAWRIKSECKAYKRELECLRQLYKSLAEGSIHQGIVRARIKQVKQSMNYYKCSES